MGTNELDFRRAMPWDAGDESLRELYREAIALRRRHPALRRGDLRFLRAEAGEQLLVFERSCPGESLTITINASPEPNALPPFSWDIRKS